MIVVISEQVILKTRGSSFKYTGVNASLYSESKRRHNRRGMISFYDEHHKKQYTPCGLVIKDCMIRDTYDKSSV